MTQRKIEKKSMGISFIVPVYNAENTIEECVKSIVNQKFDNTEFEIIIVNDGSTDHTYEVCDALRERYESIRILNKKNGGVASARNYGIEHAKHKWIMFIDGDDGLLQNAAKCLQMDAAEDIVLYSYTRSERRAEAAPEEFCVHTDVLKQMILNRAKYVREEPKLVCIDSILNWTCWGKLYRRATIVNNGCLFPEGITHGEDLIFNYQFYSAARSARCVTAPIYYYRLHPDSASKTFNPKRLENTRALLDRLKQINPVIESDPDYLMFVYNRLFACCRSYFSKENKVLSLKEKRDALEALCKEPDYRECIGLNAFADLSTGFRTRLYEWIVLRLLKNKKYDLIIKLFN